MSDIPMIGYNVSFKVSNDIYLIEKVEKVNILGKKQKRIPFKIPLIFEPAERSFSNFNKAAPNFIKIVKAKNPTISVNSPDKL